MGDYNNAAPFAQGTVLQTGGTVELTSSGGANIWQRILQIGGNGGQGTYTLKAGVLNLDGASNGIGLTWWGGTSVGTFHLDGGTLITPSIHGGSPYSMTGDTANFYFNGGTLKASASSAAAAPTAFMYTMPVNGTPVATFNVYVSTGGAIIDTNGFNPAINADVYSDPALSGGPDGGLIKNGAGTLTFNGFTDYNGPTQVNAGTLRVNSYLNSAAAFNVESGARLAGLGFLLNAPVLIKTGGAVSPGSATTAGTLTLKDLTMQTGVSLNYRLSSSVAGANDRITVNNNLSFDTTTVTVNPYQNSLGEGAYNLMSYTTLLAGNIGKLTLVLGGPYTGLPLDALRQQISLDMSTAGQVNLNVVGVRGNLTWTGAISNDWDNANRGNPAQGTKNWTNANPPVGADKYYTADDVTFAGGPWTVNLADNVLPASVTMDLGGGTINFGNKTLTTASWTANNSNINTGTGNMSVDTLSLTNCNLTAGSGSLNVNNFTLVSGNINGTGTVTVAGTAELQSGTINANLSGVSGFIKTTASTVTLKGTANAQTGNDLVARAGTLVFDTAPLLRVLPPLFPATPLDRPPQP